MKKSVSVLIALLMFLSCTSPLCPAGSASGFLSLFSSLTENRNSKKLAEKSVSLSGVKVYAALSSFSPEEMPAFAESDPDENGMICLGNADQFLTAADIYAYDISPDGSTRFVYVKDAGNFILNEREKSLIPITAAYERGVEDQYNVLKALESSALTSRPIAAAEGLVWSPDGRYAAVTNGKAVILAMNMSYQLLLIDTKTGECFLAETWPTRITKGGGAVCAACFDETGENLYYIHISTGGASRSNLYSYNLESGASTYLSACNNHYPYPPALFRAADGSLISVHYPNKIRERFTIDVHTDFMGSRWMRSMLMNAKNGIVRVEKIDFSEEAGRGIALCSSVSHASSMPESSDSLKILNFSYLECFSLNSVDDTVIVIPADSEYAKRTDADSMDPDSPSFSKEAILGQKANALIINAALSPDGRSALLVLNHSAQLNSDLRYSLKLLDLETLALTNVSVPETVNLMFSGYDLPISSQFPAGLRWFENGEILIASAKNKVLLCTLEN